MKSGEESFKRRSLSSAVLPVSPTRSLARSKTLSSFSLKRARSSVNEEYAMHVAKLRQQIKVTTYKSWLMHPVDSKFLPWWDFTTTLALLYTAVITPWETAFITVDETLNPWGEGWFLINRLVDLIFLVDMILQFFIMYPLEQKSATAQIVYVSNRWTIALNYFRGWFVLDFLTMVPSVIGMSSSLTGYSDYLARTNKSVVVVVSLDDDIQTKNLMMLRVLRAVRMIKLVRLIRASKIYERWQARVSLSFAALQIIKCVLGIFLVAHCTSGRAGRASSRRAGSNADRTRPLSTLLPICIHSCSHYALMRLGRVAIPLTLTSAGVVGGWGSCGLRRVCVHHRTPDDSAHVRPGDVARAVWLLRRGRPEAHRGKVHRGARRHHNLVPGVHHVGDAPHHRERPRRVPLPFLCGGERGDLLPAARVRADVDGHPRRILRHRHQLQPRGHPLPADQCVTDRGTSRTTHLPPPP